MIIIKNYEITSRIAPTQIEGQLLNGKEFYIRYRNCVFYAEVDNEAHRRIELWDRMGDYHREVFMETEEAFRLAGMKTAIKCRRPMKHRPEFEAKIHCKTCEGEEE